MVRSTNYNFMAPFYNSITSFISMGGNERSQCRFIPFIQSTDRVLNVGCGSIGFNVILAEHCSNVVALDLSEKMLKQLQQSILKNGLCDHVQFECRNILDYNAFEEFDVVMANFFLNTFRLNDCWIVLDHLCKLVKPGGLLCIADETPPRLPIAKFTIAVFRPMFSFIHFVLAKHPLHNIHNYTPIVNNMGFTESAKFRDSTDYILSTVYKKNVIQK